ncbi:MAG: hypothetical protein AAFW00_22875 [Bacteroidota bacterium]
MSSSVSYRSFFTIDLLQEYYLSEENDLYDGDEDIQAAILRQQRLYYQVSKDLSMKPTSETVGLMKNYGLLLKAVPLGFFIGGRVRLRTDGSAIPFIPVDTPLVLRFSLTATNPFFANFTNLRMEKVPANRDRYVYYFSNRAANVASVADGEDVNYLSTPIPGFDPERDYEAGELIVEGGIMREAVDDRGPAPSFIGGVWRDIYEDADPMPQFVTTADRTLLRPAIFDVDVTSAAQEVIVVVVRDRQNVIVQQQTYTSETTGIPLETCTIDLTHVDPARYTLEVQTVGGTPFTDLGLDFYLDSALYLEGPLAIIECFHEPDGSLGAYKWFDETDSNQLLSPRYTLRWKNRPTYWRYYLPADPASFVSPFLDTFEISPGNAIDRILVSVDPIPLTAIGRRIEATIDGETRLLPNPGPRVIYPENGRLYSEVNLGGGLGPPSL